MAQVIQVDPDQVRAQAVLLSRSAEEVEGAAEQVSAALRQLATGSGEGGLPGAAHAAARVWGEGVDAVARAGSALGEATLAAVSSYGAVEQRQTGRFADGAGR